MVFFTHISYFNSEQTNQQQQQKEAKENKKANEQEKQHQQTQHPYNRYRSVCRFRFAIFFWIGILCSVSAENECRRL